MKMWYNLLGEKGFKCMNVMFICIENVDIAFLKKPLSSRRKKFQEGWDTYS